MKISYGYIESNTYSSNHEDLGGTTSDLLTSLESLLHRLDQEVLVGIRNLTGKRSALGVSQLPSPVFDSKSRTGIASRETKSSNTTANVISEELKVKEKTLSARPAAQDLVPATLLLVAVGKCDVDVLQREVIFGKFLQTQDNGILGGILDP